MDAVHGSRLVLRLESLELALHGVDRVGIEQFAQFGVAHQLAQLRLVHRQRLRATFGERGIAVVEEVGDVAEEQRGGEGRWRVGVDCRDANAAVAHVGQRLDEGRHVEVIAQALAVGLEEHRERAEPGRDSQQVGRALTLLPQWGAHARSPLGQQQRASGILAEPCGEQRGGAELADDERLHLVRARQQQRRVGRLVHIREPHDEPVVAPQRVDVDAALLADPRGHGHRPRRVHATAARREDADTPIAEFVAHAFDHDRRGVWNHARCLQLVAQVLQQVLCRHRLEIVVARQSFDCRRGRHPQQVVHQVADGQSEFDRASGAIALPERHLARLARRRRYHHFVVRDRLDAPRRRAKHEGLAHLRLEHHLFIEFADSRGAGSGADEEHAVESAVRNRAAVGDGDAFRPLARDDRAGRAVPGDTRLQLGEFVRGVPARQHVEYAFEDAAAQLRARRGAADGVEQVVDLPVVDRGHGDDLLRDDVERVTWIARRFDGAVVHRFRDRGAGNKVAPELREHHAFAHRIDLVAAAADPLQAARDRRRRLDLDDEVDGTHIDAEFERRGGDQRAERAGLEAIFDLEPLFARDGAVVRAHQDLACEFVQRAGEPFRETPAVDEEQRRLMGANQLEQARVDGRPDGRPRAARGGRPTRDRP